VRGDGRPYVVSLRTENWMVADRAADAWSAFLFAPPSVWTTVRVPLSRFMLTHKGRLVEDRVAMNAGRVVRVGVGVAAAAGGGGAPPGQFELGIDWIRAEATGRGLVEAGGEGGGGG